MSKTLDALKEQATHWVERAEMPTSTFLFQVLANRLHQAVYIATDDEMDALKPLILFLLKDVPQASWGAPEKLSEWDQLKNGSGVT